MKKLIKSAKIISFLLCIVLFISMTSFTTPDLNFISYEQAYSTAGQMFSSLTGLTDWDEQVLTPLYDKDQNLTYYCFDFISEEQGIGYILISSDLSKSMVPEYGDNGFSPYYKNAEQDIQTIYYNPIDTFKKIDGKIIDLNGNTVSKSKIDSKVWNDSKNNNIKLISSIEDKKFNATENTGISLNSTNPGHYENLDDPWAFVSGRGGTNASAAGYATLESKIVHNTALNHVDRILNLPEIDNKPIINQGHCALVAIANCMTYWRTICCGKLPVNTQPNDDGYIQLLLKLLTYAHNQKYIDATDKKSGVSINNIPALVKESFRLYGYNNAKSTKIQNPDWATMTDRIVEWGQPFIMASTDWALYEPHALTVYAWNKISCNLNGKSIQYKFLKTANGMDTEGRYINFDSFYETDPTFYMITVEPY